MSTWSRKNSERLNAKSREWRRNNPETYKLSLKKSRIKHSERIKAYGKLYRQKNKAKINLKNTLYVANRKARDPMFKTLLNLRTRINKVLKRKSKVASTIALLGCELPQFKNHLEKRFQPGMTWDNYGKVWHVDHIIPCCLFDMHKPEQQRRCFRFSNLQPMFASQNCQKNTFLFHGEEFLPLRAV